MPRQPSPKKSRLNLEMSQSVRRRLESLRVRTEADSLAEVVRRALAVYDEVYGKLLWVEDIGGTGERTLIKIL